MTLMRRMLQYRLRRRRERRRHRRSVQERNDGYRGHQHLQNRRGKSKFQFMNDAGVWETLGPKKTFWFLIYLKHPEVGDPYFQKLFRNRFRLPHQNFLELLADIKLHPLFKRWMHKRVDTDTTLGLLLLGSLRYLGRGWTFDDLEEATCISQSVHRDFLHQFLTYGKEYLYPKYVKYPSTAAEMRAHTSEYESSGFHGAVGSMDACHILIEKCSHRLKQNHLGGKSKQTCRSFNLTCIIVVKFYILLLAIQPDGMIKL